MLPRRFTCSSHSVSLVLCEQNMKYNANTVSKNIASFCEETFSFDNTVFLQRNTVFLFGKFNLQLS